MAWHVQCLNLALLSMPGGGEWFVLLLIGLLVFGRRLPEVARNLGRTVNEFKKGLRDFQDSADEVVQGVNKFKDDVASEVKEASGLNDNDYNPYDTGGTGDDAEGYAGHEAAQATSDVNGDVTPEATAQAAPEQDENNPPGEPGK
jgi:sec-independent protein translocase protein TatA